MAVQAFGGADRMHMGHLYGDVPAPIIVAIVLAILMSNARLSARTAIA